MYFCTFSSISLSKSFFSVLCLFDFLWFVVYWFRYHICRFREDLQSIPLVPCFTTTFSLYYLYLLGFSLWIIFSWAQQQRNPVTHWSWTFKMLWSICTRFVSPVSVYLSNPVICCFFNNCQETVPRVQHVAFLLCLACLDLQLPEIFVL